MAGVSSAGLPVQTKPIHPRWTARAANAAAGDKHAKQSQFARGQCRGQNCGGKRVMTNWIDKRSRQNKPNSGLGSHGQGQHRWPCRQREPLCETNLIRELRPSVERVPRRLHSRGQTKPICPAGAARGPGYRGLALGTSVRNKANLLEGDTKDKPLLGKELW